MSSSEISDSEKKARLRLVFQEIEDKNPEIFRAYNMRQRKKSKKERNEKIHKTVVVEGNRDAPYDLEKILKELGECNTTTNTAENSKRKAKKERKRNQLKEQDIVGGNDTIKQEITHEIQPQIIREDADFLLKDFEEGLRSSFASPISTVEGFEDCTRKQGRDTKGKKAKKERKRNQLEEEKNVANVTDKKSEETTQELQSQLTRANEENAKMKGQLDDLRKFYMTMCRDFNIDLENTEETNPTTEKHRQKYDIEKSQLKTEQSKADSVHSGNQNK